MNTGRIIRDGFQLGTVARDKRLGRIFKRSVFATIVARKIGVYGIETSKDYQDAIGIYSDSVEAGYLG